MSRPLGRTSSIERDIDGNIIETASSSGVVRKLEWDARRRLIKIKNAANEQLLRFVYGDKDQILDAFDADNNKTTITYTIHLGDPLLADVTTPEGRTTELTRDTKCRVTKVEGPTGNDPLKLTGSSTTRGAFPHISGPPFT